MFLKSVLWVSPLVHAHVEDGLMLLQQQVQKKINHELPDDIGNGKRCRGPAVKVFAKNCDDHDKDGRCETVPGGVTKNECIARCRTSPDCNHIGFWSNSAQNANKQKRLCLLWTGECKTRDIDSKNVLVKVRETTTTTTTSNPTTTIAGAEQCDPSSDQYCVWRHSDDDNSCDEEGCGNRAEFRKKFAELPEVEAPINAEPDAIIAENGGVPPPQKQFHNLHFKQVSDNNLGGSGIRYVDVTTLEVDGVDRAIDCIVTAKGYEGYKPSKNGLAPGKKIGAINIMHSTSADLTFSFVYQDTSAPATMGEFFFSVFDLDTGKGNKKAGGFVKAIEKLSISGYEEYYLIPQEKGGEIVVTNGADFEGSTWGRERDNPSDPLVLDERQAKRSVSFKFAPGKSSFDLTYAVGEATHGGRNFMFSGMTNLYFCKAPKVNLDFSLASVVRNNLGGKGPETEKPEGILYSNIASIDGETIDLEVNALEPYYPFNIEQNGLNGEFAQINMGTPSPSGWTGECEFKFTLLKGGSSEGYEAEWMYFSMFDLDQAKSNKKWNPKWQESLTVSGFASQYISDGSQIKIEQLDKRTFRYNSSQKGTGKDNPSDPMQLDAVMLSRTATFVYRAVTSWKARFSIGLPSAYNGRNFLIAGKSSTVSCDQNTYGDVINVKSHVTPPPR